MGVLSLFAPIFVIGYIRRYQGRLMFMPHVHMNTLKFIGMSRKGVVVTGGSSLGPFSSQSFLD